MRSPTAGVTLERRRASAATIASAAPDALDIPTIYGNYDHAIARDEHDCGCGCAYITPHDLELGQQSVEWTLTHTD